MTPHETAHGATVAPFSAPEVEELHARLYRDGVIGLPGAFDRSWVQRLGEDVDVAFADALDRADGAVGRGPNRYYVEIHPEQLRGFVELATHPWISAVCESVLGPDYRIVEVGFDVPLPGAVDQPWHRDFPMPDVTRDTGTLDSLAINVTTVDTEEDMGPFEIAPGTQFDDGTDFEHGMFPPKSAYPRYQERASRRYPRMGDISIRSALTVHRGTENHSRKSRPVLVLGVDGPGAINGERHDLAVTSRFWATLPESLRAHLDCPIVDTLRPITQKHTIEGLVMGAS
ncbi:phytanoyl-CoA dioxygenase family protein [Actinophytocola gossypii]|uniref:Phytanoyl-CoA dioxygenase family protein n=1 Tax=Actinophytocola gossypii TaxID=2812003 RepID=A0ABT2J2S5_9PSEU|nr:phytanoyl-CoA dioxygenase family protein [Actinophytocola gossypii]MCT2582108.1 phytanoyl-CoA dioxygenase family protein [Actinophytocola gossypii]